MGLYNRAFENYLVIAPQMRWYESGGIDAGTQKS